MDNFAFFFPRFLLKFLSASLICLSASNNSCPPTLGGSFFFSDFDFRHMAVFFSPPPCSWFIFPLASPQGLSFGRDFFRFYVVSPGLPPPRVSTPPAWVFFAFLGPFSREYLPPPNSQEMPLSATFPPGAVAFFAGAQTFFLPLGGMHVSPPASLDLMAKYPSPPSFPIFFLFFFPCFVFWIRRWSLPIAFYSLCPENSQRFPRLSIFRPPVLSSPLAPIVRFWRCQHSPSVTRPCPP